MATDTPDKPSVNPDLILDNWRNELDSAHIYRFLANRESDSLRASLLREMADSETRHAAIMEQGLREFGVKVPKHKLSPQTRILKAIASLLGPKAVYPMLHGSEISGSTAYASQDARTAALAPEERSHARMLGQIDKPRARQTESWHRVAGGGGSIRAAVFGVSDGLVSNLSLVMGFAGASVASDVVLLGGLSGLIAGAASMAAGEYVSVKAQRELFERQIEMERAELAVTPEEEEQELALIYRAKGMPKAEAERIAARLSADPEVALDALVREELGLDPSQLGSPEGAATSSFIAFALGAILPVLPFFFGAAFGNVLLSLVLSGVALFGVGAALSLFTGRSLAFSGTRQLVIGAVAAAITFGVGTLIGVSTGV